jgi:hypothetical protein
VIRSAIAGALIRRIQKCVDFRARYEVDQLAVKVFGRHGEDALDLSAMGRQLIGGKAEERSNRGEAKIAGACGDTPCLSSSLKNVEMNGASIISNANGSETCATALRKAQPNYKR